MLNAQQGWDRRRGSTGSASDLLLATWHNLPSSGSRRLPYCTNAIYPGTYFSLATLSAALRRLPRPLVCVTTGAREAASTAPLTSTTSVASARRPAPRPEAFPPLRAGSVCAFTWMTMASRKSKAQTESTTQSGKSGSFLRRRHRAAVVETAFRKRESLFRFSCSDATDPK